jgi:hypothetical protein
MLKKVFELSSTLYRNEGLIMSNVSKKTIYKLKLFILLFAMLLSMSKNLYFISNDLIYHQLKVYANDTIKTISSFNDKNTRDIVKWDGVSTEEYTGSGTEEDPYIIENGAQLNKISYDAINDINHYQDEYFKLISDIDLDGYEWTPIGSKGISFEGNFDGNNKTIYGLNINVAQQNYYGLFAYVYGGVIHDVNISNYYIYNNTNASADIGGLVGYLNEYSSVYNCCVSGEILQSNVSSSTSYIGGIVGYSVLSNIHNCCADVNIECDNTNAYVIGGIAGRIVYQDDEKSFDLYNCYVHGNIKSDKYVMYAGGLIGHTDNSGIIRDSSADVNIDIYEVSYIGGLIGTAGYVFNGDSVIDNCCAFGSINNSNSNETSVGGLIGEVRTGHVIRNCYALEHITGMYYYIGGLLGRIYNNSVNNVVENCYAMCDINIDVATYSGGLIGLINMYSGLPISISNCYSLGNLSTQRWSDYLGGLIGRMTYVDATLSNCYTANRICVNGTPGYDIYVDAFIGNIGTNASCLISDCYYNKQICGSFKGDQINSIQDGVIGLNTQQMTGESSKFFMRGLFKDVNGNIAFSQTEVPDVFVDGICKSHYPQLRSFAASKNFKRVADSEYSTRVNILNLCHMNKKVSHINKISKDINKFMQTIRMR